MKTIIGNAISFALLALLFGPTVIGAVDLAWYFYTDHALTAINWTEGRVMYALFFPLMAACAVGVASA